MAKPTKPTVPPAPSRANSGADFSVKADTFAAFQTTFADYIDATAEFVDERADEALAAALAGDLPALTGRALNMSRVNATGTAVEFRTPQQVRESDLGISGPGGSIAATITNLDTHATGGTFFAASTATGLPLAEASVVMHHPADTAAWSVQETISLTTVRRFWRRETSAGVWAAWVEVQAALGFTPVEQGGGTDMGTNKVRIGWRIDNTGIQAQVDGIFHGVLAIKSEVPKMPQAAPGVGQFRALIAAAGVALVLPAGGTWAYHYTFFNGAGTWVTSASSVAAGGSTISGTNDVKSGFAWRIA